MKFEIGDKVVMVSPDQIISGEIVSEPWKRTSNGVPYKEYCYIVKLADFTTAAFESELVPFADAYYFLKNSIGLYDENQTLRDENYRLQKEVIAWEERYYLCP